jgi:hypothetical protein
MISMFFTIVAFGLTTLSIFLIFFNSDYTPINILILAGLATALGGVLSGKDSNK